MPDYNYALYYPTIEFQSYEWLWAASLLWDRIYKIVPENYIPDEPPNVLELQDEGEIGIPIYPKEYAKQIADEFVEKLESSDWDAAALTHNEDDNVEGYMRLHGDKVDVKLKEMLIAKGQAIARDEWLSVPTEFSSQYMTYLANAIAEKNNLQLVTDLSAAWTCSTYFQYDGGIEDFPREDLEGQLAIIVIKDFLPSNISSITTKELINFRRRRHEQRKRFFNAIKKAARDISQCADPKIIQDMVHDLKINIESTLTDYRESADILRVTSWTGLKTIAIPIVTSVIEKMITFDPTSLTILSGTGIAMGAMSGLKEYKRNKKKLEKEFEYSYLIELRNRWKNTRRDGDYNYYLCRKMEEFIND
jgi:hypothetical protein